MTNKDVLMRFVMGDEKGKTKNLRIEGDNLVNYNTVIAKRKRDGRDVKKIYIDTSYYSPTTSRITNQLRRIAPEVLVEDYKSGGNRV